MAVSELKSEKYRGVTIRFWTLPDPSPGVQFHIDSPHVSGYPNAFRTKEDAFARAKQDIDKAIRIDIQYPALPGSLGYGKKKWWD